MKKNDYLNNGKYFYGNVISEHGLKNGYVDYNTLRKALREISGAERVSCWMFDDEREDILDFHETVKGTLILEVF